MDWMEAEPRLMMPRAGRCRGACGIRGFEAGWFGTALISSMQRGEQHFSESLTASENQTRVLYDYEQLRV